MADVQLECADAWLFLAIGYAARHRSGSLADVIGVADGIQHAIPTVEEINGAIGRLTRAGYLMEFRGQRLLPSEAGSALLHRVESGGGNVFDKLERLQQFIGAARWTPDYDPTRAQRGEDDAVDAGDLARALAAYLRSMSDE